VAQPSSTPPESGQASKQSGAHARSSPINQVHPNPHQPRQDFDEAALAALAESIKHSGMMQPIVVRPAEKGGFEIIAGERRWRAAQAAEFDSIDAIVRDVDDRTAAQFSLVENLQREDLNPIERAEAFRRLVQEFNMTHQEVAESVGLDRTSVSNHLRLNELDDDTKSAVRKGILSLGHAKALLALANNDRRRAAAQQAIARGWSVRELERRVRVMVENPSANHDSAVGSRDARTVPPHMADLQKRLAAHLGTKVSIRPGRTKNAGTLMIEFFDLDQFEGLLERLQFEMD
jgi:ParB family chromosome partitioning protein